MLYFTRILPDSAYANTALTKADQDFAFYMAELGAKEILLSPADDLSLKFLNVNSSDAVIYQHPTFRGIRFEFQILEAVHSQGARVITFVHDSLVIRNEEVPRNNAEVALFNQSDRVIVHTKSMKKRLKSYGVSRPMIIQGLFGYRVAEDVELSHQADDFKHLIYAGNLWKSSFMLSYSSKVELELFGKWPNGWETSDKILPAAVHYRGEVAAEDLPLADFTGFGLSWDGWNVPDMSLDGRYTKYNCSLKISNYLAYGLPVIVWSESAVADEIKGEGLGLLLDDLRNLDDLFASITYQDYQALLEHVAAYGKRVRSGLNTKGAILLALKN